MSFRGGRDRPRRDYPLRSEEKSHHGRSTAPPSRHLWVGNLSHTLSEGALSNHFRQFGELESIAFQPGRSYAFINFIDDNAAFAAIEALQGFILAGNALKIEFTKADKSSHDEDYSRPRDASRSSIRESPFPQRDSRPRHITSDPIYHNENPKTNNKNPEQPPSEVLWVGFPESLKVDKDSLYDAFSPFGEIENISAFPGRTYAFIRYKNINSASRAKENLHGKLFNNPRVHICFARSDSGNPNGTRNFMKDPPSPRVKPYGRRDRYHEPDRTRRSPRFVGPDGGFDDDVMGFDRKGNRFDQPRFQEVGPDIGLPGNIHGRNSPSRNRRGGFHDFQRRDFPNREALYDDEWDLPEDNLGYHGTKKLKPDMGRNEPELPEYPFSESERVKHVISRPPPHEFDNNLGRFGYHNNHKQITDLPPGNIHQPFIERGNLGNSSYDSFRGGSGSVEWKRPSPERASDEWKWEGIIAKGGTSICRARCFPVGKVLDMILPEFLDCTARTSLDMLAKHYYQAASSWVVFFVPESDADMAFYNEFMNYLGEKQRAAVAKLDDKTTLFLVPPSDFSEKVLKVPGKLSISGVVLRLESSSTTAEALPPPPQPPLPPPPPPPQLQPERPDPYLVSSHGEASRTFSSLSGPYPPTQPFPNFGGPRPPGPVPFYQNRNMVEPPVVENTQPHDHLVHQQPTHPQYSGINPAPFRGGGDFVIPPNETGLNNYRPGSPTVMPRHQETNVIQQDQLAQLASFLGNSRQSGEDFRQSSNTVISDNVYRMPQTLPSPSSQMSSGNQPSSKYRQVPQFQQFQQQVSNTAPVTQTEFSTSGQGNMQNGGDADPQKRLQATLELAATLLKQIQQGKS